MTLPHRGLATVLATVLTVALLCLAWGVASHAQEAPRDLADPWIEGDIEAGYALAAETGKPLLVAFR